MKTPIRHTIYLAVLGGLAGILAAIIFLPAYAADAELAALVIGALAVYALGAMAMVEYNRTRAAAKWRARVRPVANRPIVVPAPTSRRVEERMAA